KSAHEPYTRTERSKEDAFQRNALLDDIFAQIVGDIAQGRGATLSEVRHLIDTAPFGPQESIDANLADATAYRDEVLTRISEEVGFDVVFARFPDTTPAKPTWSTEPYIGVVLVEGTIVDGESLSIPLLGIRNAGGDTIAETIRTLRADRACRGILLRVNSPGGSALASDIIWREVELTRLAHEKDQRKPAIVVSMGDVAASGGYYVATGAREIFALPTTITGSIGVVSLHFDVSEMLEKLDITRDAITRGLNADISRYTPWTDDQRARMQASILRVYELFLSRVSEARGMSRDEVHALARGRVYSGADALEVGLIDKIGGIEAARARLAEQMGMSN
ncbi:MAG: signal peptide peptidase SppA, partial [Nannocystaceae bacterium]